MKRRTRGIMMVCTALVKTAQGLRACGKDALRRNLCQGHLTARKLYKNNQTKHITKNPERNYKKDVMVKFGVSGKKARKLLRQARRARAEVQATS